MAIVAHHSLAAHEPAYLVRFKPDFAVFNSEKLLDEIREPWVGLQYDERSGMPEWLWDTLTVVSDGASYKFKYRPDQDNLRWKAEVYRELDFYTNEQSPEDRIVALSFLKEFTKGDQPGDILVVVPMDSRGLSIHVRDAYLTANQDMQSWLNDAFSCMDETLHQWVMDQETDKAWRQWGEMAYFSHLISTHCGVAMSRLAINSAAFYHEARELVSPEALERAFSDTLSRQGLDWELGEGGVMIDMQAAAEATDPREYPELASALVFARWRASHG